MLLQQRSATLGDPKRTAIIVIRKSLYVDQQDFALLITFQHFVVNQPPHRGIEAGTLGVILQPRSLRVGGARCERSTLQGGGLVRDNRCQQRCCVPGGSIALHVLFSYLSILRTSYATTGALRASADRGMPPPIQGPYGG